MLILTTSQERGCKWAYVQGQLKIASYITGPVCMSSCDLVCYNQIYICVEYYECLMYAGQEATVRTGHGTTDWFQIGKGVRQGCILSPCLFNLYAEYIMRNAELDKAQAGIKIAGRNINNLRYEDDTTPMAESEKELKSLLMKVTQHSKN